MAIRTDGPAAAAEELVLRWTLERREFMEAVRHSVGKRIWHTVRTFVILGAIWTAGTIVFLTAELTIRDGRLPSPRAVLAVLADVASMREAVPMGLVLSCIAAVFMLTPWWYPEWSGWRLWRRNPSLRGPWEAVLQPTGITVRGAHVESTFLWTAFDAVSDAGLSFRLHMRDRRPAPYVVIPKRAMPGANGPAELGELLRRRVGAPNG